MVAGRIPATNMYESLLFLAWGVGLFAVIAGALFLSYESALDRLIPLYAGALGVFAIVGWVRLTMALNEGPLIPDSNVEWTGHRQGNIANRFRESLVKWYGEEKGEAVKYAEAFEICEIDDRTIAHVRENYRFLKDRLDHYDV